MHKHFLDLFFLGLWLYITASGHSGVCFVWLLFRSGIKSLGYINQEESVKQPKVFIWGRRTCSMGDREGGNGPCAQNCRWGGQVSKGRTHKVTKLLLKE